MPTSSHCFRVVSLDKEHVVLALSYVTPWQFILELKHFDTHFAKLRTFLTFSSTWDTQLPLGCFCSSIDLRFAYNRSQNLSDLAI